MSCLHIAETIVSKGQVVPYPNEASSRLYRLLRLDRSPRPLCPRFPDDRDSDNLLPATVERSSKAVESRGAVRVPILHEGVATNNPHA